MKFIDKNREPASLLRWKRQNREYKNILWKYLRSDVRSEIKKSLLDEQGHICCYCCMRINSSNSQIEHLKPKASNKFPQNKFDYKDNLLASCDGGSEYNKANNTNVSHCGKKKKDWYNQDLLVSPLCQFCEEYFIFTSRGEILPSTEESKKTKAVTTIRKLGLNAYDLRDYRKRAITSFIMNHPEFTTKTSSERNEAVQTLIRRLREKDNKHMFDEFCTTIISVLKQYIEE
ncbi:MAG TPA: TIGR02646 family protein [Candidatus Cloacimonetes bacterium]|nr:TIGR02646 family protein [Candidatus Cloacimonadota bacterium]